MKNLKKSLFYRGCLSSGLSHPNPYHGDQAGAKTDDIREQHQHVTVIITRVESKQLKKKPSEFNKT